MAGHDCGSGGGCVNELPSETRCGECNAVVPLDPRKWLVEEERGGANQLCHCGRCYATVFAIVGTPEYLQRTAIKASSFVALHRRELLH
jgi:hypothetical protein